MKVNTQIKQIRMFGIVSLSFMQYPRSKIFFIQKQKWFRASAEMENFVFLKKV